MGFVSTTLVLAIVSYLMLRCEGLKEFLTVTDKTSWAWELTSFSYFLRVSQDTKQQVAGYYWAKALAITGICAFGGGFLAPIIVGRVPYPLMEETYIWMLVTAWYATHHIPVFSDFLGDIMNERLSWVFFTVIYGVFKTNQIVGVVELASKAVSSETLLGYSRYFPVPYAAPLLCGFVGGCGGAFLPLSKGFEAIEAGKAWNVRAAFFTSVIYVAASRCWGFELLNAKMFVCSLRIAGEIFPRPRDALLATLTTGLYKGTGLRSTPLPTVIPLAKKAT